MVTDRLTDGVRIAQLLASEVTGNRGRLRDLVVTDADPDVEPTVDGALAYSLALAPKREDDGEGGNGDEEDGTDEDGTDADEGDEDGSERVADVFVQPDRVRVEFVVAPDVAATTAEGAGLRVRPKAVRPPRTLVFLEDGAAVKRVLPTLEAVLEAALEVTPADAGGE
ncbi:hypothetical protein GRS48_02670 [Halorubrum sp. JWXQ-INN 858]|uniref:hypothetical protein n=1 Tax=Halorubrum sp. JWXQ-INN 858 TaxID=2690782 RepID=UPI00135AD965|nr:hypothetical protein [Halorubrum sp. JWXQ-INN 858]MWV63731.1 hypothetical protein [Halorubrum sp. JWXQ-INN 858]